MLILATTTDKFQLITDAAVTVDVHASFMDLSGTTATPGKQNTAITTAATTDIVSAPGASTYRNLKTLTVRNKHATSSVIVTFQFNQNGTVFEIHKVQLLAGEMLEYIEGVGFFTLANSTVANPVTVARLSADQSNSTTTLTEVTNLSTATGTGTYIFQYMLITQSAATTTGQRFSVNYDGTVTSFVANWYGVDATATASTAAMSQAATGAAMQVFSVNSARAKSTTGWGTSISVDTANADMLVLIDGIMIVTVAGNIELWHASEVAASSTVKAGSSLILTKTA